MMQFVYTYNVNVTSSPYVNLASTHMMNEHKQSTVFAIPLLLYMWHRTLLRCIFRSH